MSTLASGSDSQAWCGLDVNVDVKNLLRKSDGLTSGSIEMLDTRAPRYTSYPNADRFVEAFGARDYTAYLSARAMSHGVPLSVYLHIPFCSQSCFHCACNKTITQQYDKAILYVDSLISELALVDSYLSSNRRLTQMHWGGGTPTFLKAPEILRLMDALKNTFDIEVNGDYSIEIDARTTDRSMLELLKEQGFNRLSLGVQDLNLSVQHAINRVQSPGLVEQLLNDSRELGFSSTNFDLMVGLPKQNLAGYRATLESVIQLRPERISLHNYNHLPTRFKGQRLISDDEIPCAEEKLDILLIANELLTDAGYEYMGVDHFALPEDGLSRARKFGRLHWNFQGYSTQPDCDLVALGVSAISRIGSCYSQNLQNVNEYSDRIAQGVLPTSRGLELTRDDLLRRALILAILCQGEVDKQSVEIAYLIDFDKYFDEELGLLQPFVSLGFVVLDEQLITVTESGRRKALRLIACTFDRHLKDQCARQRYLRVL